jgi:hypothetical protein
MFTVPANVIPYSNIRGVYGERVQNYAWIRSRSMFLLWENPDLLYAGRPVPHMRLSEKKLTRKPEGHGVSS